MAKFELRSDGTAEFFDLKPDIKILGWTLRSDGTMTIETEDDDG